MMTNPSNRGITPMLRHLPTNLVRLFADVPRSSLLVSMPIRNKVTKIAAPSAMLEVATTVTVLTVTVDTIFTALPV